MDALSVTPELMPLELFIVFMFCHARFGKNKTCYCDFALDYGEIPK